MSNLLRHLVSVYILSSDETIVIKKFISLNKASAPLLVDAPPSSLIVPAEGHIGTFEDALLFHAVDWI